MSLFGSGFLPCPSPFNPLSRPVPLPSTLLRKSRFVGSSPRVFKTSHRSVLTPADKEHALPEFAVQQLNALIEGDTAVKCFFLLLPPPFPFFFFFAVPPRRFEENKKKKLALTRALPFSLSLSLSPFRRRSPSTAARGGSPRPGWKTFAPSLSSSPALRAPRAARRPTFSSSAARSRRSAPRARSQSSGLRRSRRRRART